MYSKVFPVKLRSGHVIAVATNDCECEGYRPAQIIRLYRRSTNLRELAERFGISPALVRKLLRLAKIDYVLDLYGQYETGKTCTEIARENGMKVATLTVLFAARNLSVSRGRKRPNIKMTAAARVWAVCRTINEFSKALDTHWTTGSRILGDFGLIETVKSASSRRDNEIREGPN